MFRPGNQTIWLLTLGNASPFRVFPRGGPFLQVTACHVLAYSTFIFIMRFFWFHPCWQKCLHHHLWASSSPVPYNHVGAVLPGPVTILQSHKNSPFFLKYYVRFCATTCFTVIGQFIPAREVSQDNNISLLYIFCSVLFTSSFPARWSWERDSRQKWRTSFQVFYSMSQPLPATNESKEGSSVG